MFAVVDMSEQEVSNHMTEFCRDTGIVVQTSRFVKKQKFSLSNFFLLGVKKMQGCMPQLMDWSGDGLIEEFIKATIGNEGGDIVPYKESLCKGLKKVDWNAFLQYLGVRELQPTIAATVEAPLLDQNAATVEAPPLDQNAYMQELEAAPAAAAATTTQPQLTMVDYLQHFKSMWGSWGHQEQSAALNLIGFFKLAPHIQQQIFAFIQGTF